MTRQRYRVPGAAKRYRSWLLNNREFHVKDQTPTHKFNVEKGVSNKFLLANKRFLQASLLAMTADVICQPPGTC